MGETSSDNENNNFLFGLNDYDFSDRVLRLRIISDDKYYDDYSFDDGVNLTTSLINSIILAAKSPFFYKVFSIFSSFSGLNVSQKETEVPLKIKESENRDGVKVTTLHINSLILAAKSPFFHKLFKNGMRESQNKDDISLTIKASEEATMMDLLRFMYGDNALSSTSSARDLVHLLIISDKFEVYCCMKYCVKKLLKKLPMSLEYALLFIEIPSSVSESEIVKPLTDAAKQYLVTHYTDFTKSTLRELMDFPVSALTTILEIEGFHVTSEDEVFDFVLEWACVSYPMIEERREILTKQLARYIRFPNMSGSKLKEVLDCAYLDQEQASKFVMEALFSKVELSCDQRIHDSKNLASSSTRGCTPFYAVFFDLKKSELDSLAPSKDIHSGTFCIGGRRLYLRAKRCVREEERNYLGLYMYVYGEDGTETCTLDLEFDVMEKSSKEFKIMHQANDCILKANTGLGWHNLLKMKWTELMRDDSNYFINNILRIRARLALKNPKP